METTTNKSSISSQVAFFKGQVFPPEIIDNIVKMIPSRLEEPTGNPGNLSDEEIETVKSCLQVSRTFRRPAREMLFGNTRIDLKINDSQYFERRFSLLASLIDGSEKTEHLYPSAAKLIKTFEMATKIPILLSASQSVSEVLNHLALANGRETNGGRLECLSMRILPFLNDDILPQSIYNLAKVASTSKSVKIIWLVGIHGIPSDTFYGAKLDLLALHDCNFVLCEEENVYANQGELVATRTNNVSRGLANLRPTFSELHWSHQGANLTFAQEAGLFGIDTARTQIYQAPRPSFDEPALEVASIKIAVSCAPPAGQINLEDYTGLSPIPATFFSFARPEMLIVCLSHVLVGIPRCVHHTLLYQFRDLTPQEAVHFQQVSHINVDAMEFLHRMCRPLESLVSVTRWLTAIGASLPDNGSLESLSILLPATIFQRAQVSDITHQLQFFDQVHELIDVLTLCPFFAAIPTLQVKFSACPNHLGHLNSDIPFFFDQIQLPGRVTQVQLGDWNNVFATVS